MTNVWMCVAARDGQLAAYLDVADDLRDGRRFHIDARPLDEAAAHAVVGAAEAYARDHAALDAIVRGRRRWRAGWDLALSVAAVRRPRIRVGADVGVRRPWRRRGLALALLHHSFAQLARRGATRVGLGVDAENTTGAVRLYRRASVHAERTSDIWEKRV
jgi:ribosomal protein S18 acetylase RimI-like enzyme